MIVTCERCATQFNLDDAKVPEEGIRVRCSRCEHSFRVVSAGGSDGLQADTLAREAFGARERLGDSADTLELDDDDAISDSESDWEFNESFEAGGDGLDPADRRTRQDAAGGAASLEAASQAVDELLAVGDSAATPDLEIDGLEEDASSDSDSGLDLTDEWEIGGELDEAIDAALSPSDEDLGAASLASSDAPDSPLEDPEKWDFFGSDSSTEYHGVPSGSVASTRVDGAATVESTGPQVGAPLVVSEPRPASVWRAHAADIAGWAAVVALTAVGAFGVLGLGAVGSRAEGVWTGDRFSAEGVVGRFVDNASGPIYVISGRVRQRDGVAAGGAQPGIRLLDDQGRQLGDRTWRLGPPFVERVLREVDPTELAAQQRRGSAAFAALADEWQPFEVVIDDLPVAARRFAFEESGASER